METELEENGGKIDNDTFTDLTIENRSDNELTNVEVFCRLKPCNEKEEEKCIKLLDRSSLQVITPSSKVVGGIRQELTCAFKGILLGDASQKEVFDQVANDMVTGLVTGKNGLLFTYGITGSGKTYTLGGTSNDPGVLPRCITTLYNSIKNSLAPSSSIRLDRNGQVEFSYGVKFGSNTPMYNKKNTTVCETPVCLRKCDTPPHIDKNLMYSMFISMVEIYNNNIYDLLDDQLEHATANKPPASKILRENAARGIFIPGLTYVAVSSVSEALTFYRKGKKRRKVAETILNAHSSRSHCVFTLYLVQMERSSNNNQQSGIVSQLSLCDLAGSERMCRTQNEGDRQKESSSINSSLMTLRNCIDALRENQRMGHCGNSHRIVPYRESRLTLMFRNFFEGEGKVRMILCLNAIPGDFEENLHIVRFAEVTQDVKVKTNKHPRTREFKRIVDTATTTPVEPSYTTLAFEPNPFPPFPTSILTSYTDIHSMPTMISYLHKCDRIRTALRKELVVMGEKVIRELTKLQRENDELKGKRDKNTGKCEDLERENSQLRHSFKIAKGKISSLDEQVKKINSENTSLKSELEVIRQKHASERSARHILKTKLKEVHAQEDIRLERECNKRVHEATEEMQNKLFRHDQRMKVVKGVLHDTTCLPSLSEMSANNTYKPSSKPNINKSPPKDSVVKPRKRKSSSDGNLSKKAYI